MSWVKRLSSLGVMFFSSTVYATNLLDNKPEEFDLMIVRINNYQIPGEHKLRVDSQGNCWLGFDVLSHWLDNTKHTTDTSKSWILVEESPSLHTSCQLDRSRGEVDIKLPAERLAKRMLPIHNNAPASGALSDPVAMVDWQLGSRRRSWAIQSGDQDYQFRLYHSLQGTRGVLDVDLKSKGYLQLGWLTPQFQFGSLYQLSRGIRWSSHLDQLASHQARASAQIPVLSPSRLFLTNQSGQAIAAQGVFLSPGIYNIHSIDAARFGTLHAHLLDQQGNIQSYSMPWHRHPQLFSRGELRQAFEIQQSFSDSWSEIQARYQGWYGLTNDLSIGSRQSFGLHRIYSDYGFFWRPMSSLIISGWQLQGQQAQCRLKCAGRSELSWHLQASSDLLWQGTLARSRLQSIDDKVIGYAFEPLSLASTSGLQQSLHWQWREGSSFGLHHSKQGTHSRLGMQLTSRIGTHWHLSLSATRQVSTQQLVIGLGYGEAQTQWHASWSQASGSTVSSYHQSSNNHGNFYVGASVHQANKGLQAWGGWSSSWLDMNWGRWGLGRSEWRASGRLWINHGGIQLGPPQGRLLIKFVGGPPHGSLLLAGELPVRLDARGEATLTPRYFSPTLHFQLGADDSDFDVVIVKERGRLVVSPDRRYTVDLSDHWSKSLQWYLPRSTIAAPATAQGPSRWLDRFGRMVRIESDGAVDLNDLKRLPIHGPDEKGLLWQCGAPLLPTSKLAHAELECSLLP